MSFRAHPQLLLLGLGLLPLFHHAIPGSAETGEITSALQAATPSSRENFWTLDECCNISFPSSRWTWKLQVLLISLHQNGRRSSGSECLYLCTQWGMPGPSHQCSMKVTSQSLWHLLKCGTLDMCFNSFSPQGAVGISPVAFACSFYSEMKKGRGLRMPKDTIACE